MRLRALSVALSLLLLLSPLVIGTVTATLARSDPHYVKRLAPSINLVLGQMAREVTADPLLLAALRDGNRDHAGLSAAEIAKRDQQWRQEAKPGHGPFVDGLLTVPASKQLLALRNEQESIIADMVLVDDRGLIVALTRLTSDYDQSDEEKFTRTFPNGAGAVHLEDPYFDESVQDYVLTASVVIADPDNGRPLGVLVVNIDLAGLDS